MVHVCQKVAEIIDPTTKCVDSVIVTGTAKSFNAHVGFILDDVLKVALPATRTPVYGDSTTEPVTKKSKSSTGVASENLDVDDDAAMLQGRFLINSVLKTLLEAMTPTKDTPTSTEVWIPRNSCTKSSDASQPSTIAPLLVVLIVLPSTATLSRHNSPGQPCTVTSMLKKHVRLTESTVIVPLLERAEDTRSVVSAIARVSGALMYNRKTSAAIKTMNSNDGAHDKHHPPIARKAVPLVLPSISGTLINETALPSLNHIRVLVGPPACISPLSTTLQEELASIALGIQLTRRLVDAPCSELHTTAFKEQALAICQSLSHALDSNGAGTISTKIIEGEDLDKQGFGGLYGVGKAAVHPPALVVLSYTPSLAKDREHPSSIVLVGKGIVFDTGGLQIKNKPGMLGMKRDMGGAAAILSAFGAAVRSKKPIHRPLHAVLCLAENAVASHATRADDILHMYSGRTVEINNTDAEGRLVLSDGCSYAAKHLNPGVIIDMATLTGAQGVATGKHFGALYCNDEKLEEIAVESGRLSGDLCHPMPFAPEFFKAEYTSAVADMKNSVADRSNAQVSCAAQFILNNIPCEWIEKGGRWLHIDMAYPVFDKKDERATGYGVSLLYTMLEQLDDQGE